MAINQAGRRVNTKIVVACLRAVRIPLCECTGICLLLFVDCGWSKKDINFSLRITTVLALKIE